MSNYSLLLFDPKCEAAAWSAEQRRAFGNRTVIINPYNIHADKPGYEDLASDGFNPFLHLDPYSPDFDSDAGLLAEAMVPIDSDAREKYFTESARVLLTWLIMFVVMEARGMMKPYVVNKYHVHPTVPTVARLRELLCQPSGQTDQPDGRPTRRKFDPDNEDADDCYGVPRLARLVARDSPHAEMRNLAGQFTDWGKDVRGVARTAMTSTAGLGEEAISTDLAKGTFDFRDMKKTPTTVYVVLPPAKLQKQAGWLRLIATAALQACLRDREPHEPRVLMIFDEFFALGHLKIVEDFWAVVRGYDVQMMPILQDLPQLQKLYPTTWNTFIGNAGVVVCFAPNDPITAEWLSKRCGETTRQQVNHTYSKTKSKGTTYTEGGTTVNDGESETDTWASSPIKVALATPQKLMGLKPGEVIMILAGQQHVVPAYLPNYFEIDECIERVREKPSRNLDLQFAHRSGVSAPTKPVLALPAPLKAIRGPKDATPAHLQITSDIKEADGGWDDPSGVESATVPQMPSTPRLGAPEPMKALPAPAAPVSPETAPPPAAAVAKPKDAAPRPPLPQGSSVSIGFQYSTGMFPQFQLKP